MPSEVDLSPEEWAILGAWDTVYNEMQHNICPECLDRMKKQTRVCFYCGLEYTEESKYGTGSTRQVSPSLFKAMVKRGG
jgi:hypothetical protein